jgi:hypothetical protein
VCYPWSTPEDAAEGYAAIERGVAKYGLTFIRPRLPVAPVRRSQRHQKRSRQSHARPLRAEKAGNETQAFSNRAVVCFGTLISTSTGR